jgi:ATP-dependent Lon protease
VIPGPLYDRLEVIHLDGYSEAGKVSIARNQLSPGQLTPTVAPRPENSRDHVMPDDDGSAHSCL